MAGEAYILEAPPLGARQAHLITALSLQGPDGIAVPLIAGNARRVSKLEGLSGIRVRKVKRPRTGRHGSVDRSKHRDDAVVTITGLLTGIDANAAWAEYDAIVRALAGAVDTERLLLWTAGTTRLLQMAVRLDEMQAPAEVGPDAIKYQVTLTGADPNGYSQQLVQVAGDPLNLDVPGGLEFSEEWPLTFAPTSSGSVSVTNAGTVPTPPLFLLRGYLLDPVITLGSSELVLRGEVADGDVLHVDARDRTVTLNGTANRIGMLLFERSRWFDLPVGTSVVSLRAADFGGGASLEVQYRHAYE